MACDHVWHGSPVAAMSGPEWSRAVKSTAPKITRRGAGAVTSTNIDTPPERVFEVLADYRSYGYWVVGSRKMRGMDPGFPAAGTRFHHQVGVGPLHLNDHTQVLEVDQPRKLILKAKARPGETVLVHAGAGGVGSAAIQLGVAAGANPMRSQMELHREAIERPALPHFGRRGRGARSPGRGGGRIGLLCITRGRDH